MPETAILGMLGFATPGLFVDSALADIRIDRAVVLIAITAVFDTGVDTASHAIRSQLRLGTSFAGT